jgi:hypothetical protein
MKIVINRCYGGFGLSHAGIKRYAELKGIELYAFADERDFTQFEDRKMIPVNDVSEDAFMIHYCTTPEYSNDTYWSYYDMERDDPALVQVVEELGEAANGRCASLKVVDIEPGTQYRIEEYDGNERVEYNSDSYWNVAK